MKKLKPTLTMLICTFALSFAPASVASAGPLLFEDDFESYAVGEIPSAKWWTYAYSGGYPSDQRVRLFEGNNVFSLSSEAWAAVADAKLDRQLNYAVEADAYMMSRQGISPGTTTGARFFLRTWTSNTPHVRGGYTIWFNPDTDKVVIHITDWPNLGNYILGEAEYELDLNTWYRFKGSVTGDRYGDIKIRAFVNDMTTPILEVTDDGTKWMYYGGDRSGHTVLSGYYARNYYDNVKIYQVKATEEVEIDIKPGSFPNSINPRSKGVIPVAILTTDTFDATTVDSTTVLFGPTGTEAAPVQSALEDIDGDGDTDMILHFNTQETGILCGDASAFLMGETLGGQAIEGADSIKTVGCK